MEWSSLPAMFRARAHARGTAPLLCKRIGAHLARYTWAESRERVDRIAAALLRLGLEPGERAAVLADNGPDLAFLDLALQAAGGVAVPLYTTASVEQIRHIVEHSESRFFFFDRKSALPRIREALAAVPRPCRLVRLGAEKGKAGEDATQAGITPLAALAAEAPADRERRAVDDRIGALTPDHLSALIYTSGTTGPPKGVMLTHGNILANVTASLRMLSISEEDVHLSFLPMSHSFERTVGHYAMLAAGARIHYARSPGTVMKDFAEAAPTTALVVPRFLEKIHQRVVQEAEGLTGLRRAAWAAALRAGRARAERLRRGASVPRPQKLLTRLGEVVVFRRVHEKLGGRLRFLVSGSAPLSPELWTFFTAMGVTVIQGYGLTEASPVISVNPLERNRPDSVGRPLDNLDVRIAPDGEIEVRGPSVMKGYWRDPDATAEAVTPEGWLRTGDVGRLDEGGYLYITDRKKDIIVTAGGKNVSPQNLERMLCSDPLVAHACVVGEGRHVLAAILSPEEEAVREHAKQLGLEEKPLEYLVVHPTVETLFRHVVERVNQRVPSYERIARFHVTPRPFSMEGGELTPTLKVRRRRVAEHYAGEIDRLLS